MDTLVLSPLDSLETHLASLITSFTHTNTFTTAPQIAKDLLIDDNNLTTALFSLQQHQRNYARILHLREEVASLHEQLKDTVRSCVTFKKAIGGINPDILEYGYEDEDGVGDHDEGANVAEVDYHTLLTFAARIGKHNTLAAKEAEAESVRRKIAAKNASSTTNAAVNGTAPPATTDDAGTSPDVAMLGNNNTLESSAEVTRIDAAIALQRAQMGMSFPDAAVLRNGALGQLTLFTEQKRSQFSNETGREDDVEELITEAVEREVGRMIRESEDVKPEEKAIAEEQSAFSDSPVRERRTTAEVPVRQASTSQPQAARPAKKPPKQKLSLDFPDSDDEDEDED